MDRRIGLNIDSVQETIARTGAARRKQSAAIDEAMAHLVSAEDLIVAARNYCDEAQSGHRSLDAAGDRLAETRFWLESARIKG